MERRKTRSMIRREEELQHKDKIFYTYERRSRKHPHQRGQITEKYDKAQQFQYDYLQTLGEQEERDNQE